MSSNASNSPQPVQTEGSVHLRLYIAGNAPNSLRAIANLKAICRQFLGSEIAVDTIDVWQDPARALADGILVTPTLRRLSPRPEVNIIGDLSETNSVLAALGLEAT